ncbi:MAG: CoA-binding protein, partial [bacterium]|nr:CoA-binding protein [bacterium]
MGEPAVSRAVLDRLLWPERIAIIGASSNPDAIGGRPLRLLRQLDYPGRVYPVNPRHQTVGDVQAFPSIGSVPEPVDMAIVAVPAASVPAVLRECAAAGVGTAVVFSSGFADGGESALEAELAAAAGDGVR